ncbi:LacI family DNA-binding transcriptional regulator [Streptomyces sp. M19]
MAENPSGPPSRVRTLRRRIGRQPPGGARRDGAHGGGSAGASAARREAPTIWEVSRLAGVSHQTVSRFLRQDPSMRPETARKVAAAVEELGYRPNRAARAMRTRRSHRLTLILPGATDRMSPTLLRGAAAEAHEAGYLLDVVSLEGDAAARAARLELLLQPESTDGILSFTSFGEGRRGCRSRTSRRPASSTACTTTRCARAARTPTPR